MNLRNLISTSAIFLIALLATPSFADELKSSSDSPTMKSSSTTPSIPSATTPSTPTGVSKTEKSTPNKSMTKWNDEATLVSHLNQHVTYPATGEQIIQSCNNLTDVNSMDKTNFTTKLEKLGKTKTYASAQEVLNSVNK